MRLIDADVLVEQFDKSNFNGFVMTRLIEMQPTIDAVEVVHGRWELYPSHMHRRCSVCKVEYDKPKFNIRANYCPNCGAKMDGDGNG